MSTKGPMDFDSFLDFVNGFEFSLFKLEKVYEQIVLDIIHRSLIRGKITQNG